MAYSIQVEGLEELRHAMEQLPEKAADVAALGLYEGAGVMADAVSQAVQGIAAEPFKYAKGGQKRKPSPEEKAIVANANHGVSKFKKNGLTVQTNVGYKGTGYGKITWNHAKSGGRTKYKVGYGGKAARSQSQEGKSAGVSAKPVEVIVNAINSGTSFMEKQPFLRKAFRQNQRAAEAAIEAGIKAHEDMLDPGQN